jgi:hypothetical protein
MEAMDRRSHWEGVYETKAPDQVSWFRPHLQMSLDLIERAAPDRSASIIDVGAGPSTLVDDLLVAGYHNLTFSTYRNQLPTLHGTAWAKPLRRLNGCV